MSQFEPLGTIPLDPRRMEAWVEFLYYDGERSLDDERWKIGIDDKLRQCRIAADVSLARGVQRLRIDLPNHVSQIQIAIPDVLHVAATDGAQIAFFALSHSNRKIPRTKEPKNRKPDVRRVDCFLVLWFFGNWNLELRNASSARC